MNIKQIDFLHIFKIAAAASIGCLLAVLFQLQTPTSAGIIAILSLQNTRRETFSLVARRIFSFFPSMAVAIIVFYLMGYQIPSIFVYLILFAGICELFSLQNTLVSNTVLVLHLYAAQSVHPALLVNELLLLLTGTSCGILMNLYMPGNSAKIRRAQSELEQIFRNTFHRIARDIVMDKQLACTFFDLSDLDLILKKLEKEAHENQGNTLLSDEQYFVKYVEMRKNLIFKNVASVPPQLNPRYRILYITKNPPLQGTLERSVLSDRLLVAYVPLPAEGSASVPPCPNPGLKSIK